VVWILVAMMSLSGALIHALDCDGGQNTNAVVIDASQTSYVARGCIFGAGLTIPGTKPGFVVQLDDCSVTGDIVIGTTAAQEAGAAVSVTMNRVSVNGSLFVRRRSVRELRLSSVTADGMMLSEVTVMRGQIMLIDLVLRTSRSFYESASLGGVFTSAGYPALRQRTSLGMYRCQITDSAFHMQRVSMPGALAYVAVSSWQNASIAVVDSDLDAFSDDCNSCVSAVSRMASPALITSNSSFRFSLAAVGAMNISMTEANVELVVLTNHKALRRVEILPRSFKVESAYESVPLSVSSMGSISVTFNRTGTGASIQAVQLSQCAPVYFVMRGVRILSDVKVSATSSAPIAVATFTLSDVDVGGAIFLNFVRFGPGATMELTRIAAEVLGWSNLDFGGVTVNLVDFRARGSRSVADGSSTDFAESVMPSQLSTQSSRNSNTSHLLWNVRMDGTVLNFTRVVYPGALFLVFPTMSDAQFSLTDTTMHQGILQIKGAVTGAAKGSITGNSAITLVRSTLDAIDVTAGGLNITAIDARVPNVAVSGGSLIDFALEPSLFRLKMLPVASATILLQNIALTTMQPVVGTVSLNAITVAGAVSIRFVKLHLLAITFVKGSLDILRLQNAEIIDHVQLHGTSPFRAHSLHFVDVTIGRMLSLSQTTFGLASFITLTRISVGYVGWLGVTLTGCAVSLTSVSVQQSRSLVGYSPGDAALSMPEKQPDALHANTSFAFASSTIVDTTFCVRGASVPGALMMSQLTWINSSVLLSDSSFAYGVTSKCSVGNCVSSVRGNFDAGSSLIICRSRIGVVELVGANVSLVLYDVQQESATISTSTTGDITFDGRRQRVAHGKAEFVLRNIVAVTPQETSLIHLGSIDLLTQGNGARLLIQNVSLTGLQVTGGGTNGQSVSTLMVHNTVVTGRCSVTSHKTIRSLVVDSAIVDDLYFEGLTFQATADTYPALLLRHVIARVTLWNTLNVNSRRAVLHNVTLNATRFGQSSQGFDFTSGGTLISSSASFAVTSSTFTNTSLCMSLLRLPGELVLMVNALGSVQWTVRDISTTGIFTGPSNYLPTTLTGAVAFRFASSQLGAVKFDRLSGSTTLYMEFTDASEAKLTGLSRGTVWTSLDSTITLQNLPTTVVRATAPTAVPLGMDCIDPLAVPAYAVASFVEADLTLQCPSIVELETPTTAAPAQPTTFPSTNDSNSSTTPTTAIASSNPAEHPSVSPTPVQVTETSSSGGQTGSDFSSERPTPRAENTTPTPVVTSAPTRASATTRTVSTSLDTPTPLMLLNDRADTVLIPPTATVVATGVGAAATAALGAMAVPSAASQPARLMSLKRLADCGLGTSEPTQIEHPFAFLEIVADDSSVNAAATSTILLAILSLPGLTLGHARRGAEQPRWSAHAGVAFGVAVAYLAPSIGVAAAASIATNVHVSLDLVILAGCASVLVVAAALWVRRSEEGPIGVMKPFLMPLRDPPQRDFRRRLADWLFIIDVVAASGIGLCTGALASSCSRPIALLALTIALAFALYLSVLRPFDGRLETALAVVSAWWQVALAVLAVAATWNGADDPSGASAAEALDVLGFGLSLFFLVQALVLALVALYERCREGAKSLSAPTQASDTHDAPLLAEIPTAQQEIQDRTTEGNHGPRRIANPLHRHDLGTHV
jgi:hypothetical protein